MRNRAFPCGIGLLAAALVAAVGVPVARAQERASLADRVSALEQQQARANEGTLSLVNRLQNLEQQVRDLQGQIEQLQHQQQESDQRQKDQYVDLDSRLSRLEGKPLGAAPASSVNPARSMSAGAPVPAPTGSATVAPPPAADAPVPPPALAAAAVPAAAPVNPAAAEQTAYDHAFQALRDGDYAESARRFRAFMAQYPGSTLAPNADYWLGESYYVTQNFQVSLQTFQGLLARYPGSPKAPDALLKVGYCQYELKQWAAARTTLEAVVAKYPNTTVAHLAEGRLRAIRLQTGG
ncbi:MAG: tol-pal system protein YbgF [Xanthomonadaceae bacterium]|nr:tol-pal system protein YbgF [Xanthomonadaceae bacterium]